jgi:hypothetical protein
VYVGPTTPLVVVVALLVVVVGGTEPVEDVAAALADELVDVLTTAVCAL